MWNRKILPFVSIVGWSPTVKHVFIVCVVALYALSLWETGTNPRAFIEGLPLIVEFLGHLFPPHFIAWDKPYFYNPEADLQPIFSAALETLQIAIMGTVLATIGGFLLAVLAARNLSPSYAIYQVARTVADSFRGISELVWALLFVAMIGLGPFTGVLALTVHNSGALAKYFSETIEAIQVGILEAVESSGATRTQVFFHGVMPELRALFVNYILYYFEHNLRQATVLGFVGAGGIGTLLMLEVTYFNYEKVLTLVLILLAMVIVADRLSGLIRKKLVGGEIVVVA